MGWLHAFRSAGLALMVLVLLGIGPVTAMPRLLIDMHSGQVLYAEEVGQPWHPASLTKLMTALVTFRAIEQGRVSLDTPVILTRAALKMPPSHTGLPVDTALTLRDALYVLLVKSANDMAIAIAQTVGGSVDNFVAEMNATAQQMGLTATHYVDPNGLSATGQYNSARDLAIIALTIRARYPQYADIFSTEAVQVGSRLLKSHNELLTDYPGTTGMKTGFICAAGLNIVATAQRGGAALMAVVLGASSGRERAEMVGQLFDQGFAGQLQGTGQTVMDLKDLPNAKPVDMKPFICGKQAKAFVAQRATEFPYGLEGEESFLNPDSVAPKIYTAHVLGRFRNVPLPQPRPLWAPAVPAPVAAAETGPGGIPLPRPRPVPVNGG